MSEAGPSSASPLGGEKIDVRVGFLSLKRMRELEMALDPLTQGWHDGPRRIVRIVSSGKTSPIRPGYTQPLRWLLYAVAFVRQSR